MNQNSDIEQQPAEDEDDLGWLFTEPWHLLPDDHPEVVRLRERFFAALDAHEQEGRGGSAGA